MDDEGICVDSNLDSDLTSVSESIPSSVLARKASLLHMGPNSRQDVSSDRPTPSPPRNQTGRDISISFGDRRTPSLRKGEPPMLRRVSRAIAVAVFASLTLLSPIARAGTTGKLTGVVKNDKGQPVAGANVRIEGLRIGALSDDEGRFLIIGLPAGEYSVRVNMMGFTGYLAEKVTITPDFTTELNVQLKTEAVEMAEVKVEAERPLLQKDATGTTRFINSDDIQ